MPISLPFIHLKGPNLSVDEDVRRAVHSRASLLGAAGRKRCRGKQTLPKGRGRDVEEEIPPKAMQLMYMTKLNNPLNLNVFAYEHARSRFGVDILALLLLVNTDIHGLTDAVLSTQTWVSSILDSSNESYLSYIPIRYGLSDCLTKAVDCLMLCLRNILLPDAIPATRLHIHALKSLQHAISDPVLSQNSETLCATHLLSLYALLDPTDLGWSQHVKGCAALIQHRNAPLETAFDKALFIASIGPATFQSTRALAHCFIEEPVWCDRLMSLSEDTGVLTMRHPIVLKVRKLVNLMAGLWLDFALIVPTPKFFDDNTDLLLRTEALYREFEAFLHEFREYCILNPLPVAMAHKEEAMRRDTLGRALGASLIVQRMLGTMLESWRHELNLDRQVQALIRNQAANKHGGIFSNQELTIVNSMIASNPLFEQRTDHLSMYDQRLAAQARYMAWTAAALAGIPSQNSLR